MGTSYSTIRPVFGSSLPSFPVLNPPYQTIPAESTPSRRMVVGVSAEYSVNVSVLGSNFAILPRRNSANQTFSSLSRLMPYGAAPDVGTFHTRAFSVLRSHLPSMSPPMTVNQTFSFESMTDVWPRAPLPWPVESIGYRSIEPVLGSRRPRWKPTVSAQNTWPALSTVRPCGSP